MSVQDVITAWVQANDGKSLWLVVHYGHDYNDRITPELCIAKLCKDKIATLRIHANAEVKPDVVIDIRKDLHLFPDQVFAGVLFFNYYCKLTDEVITEFKRIVKPSGYWVTRFAFVPNKSALNIITAWYIHQKDNLLGDNTYFTVPYKFRYQLPKLFIPIFKDFLHKCYIEEQSRKELISKIPDYKYELTLKEWNIQTFCLHFGSVPEDFLIIE